MGNHIPLDWSPESDALLLRVRGGSDKSECPARRWGSGSVGIGGPGNLLGSSLLLIAFLVQGTVNCGL